MSVKLIFIQSASGRSYVEDYLNKLNDDERATILAVFEDIEKYGFSATGCQFRRIEGKLWEIKIKTRGGGYRFFYVLLSKDEMAILHAYKKQTRKAPKKELKVARKRMKEVLRWQK